MERTRFFRRPVVWIILVIIGAIALSSFFTGRDNYTEVETSVALDRLNSGGIEKVVIEDREQTLKIDLAEPMTVDGQETDRIRRSTRPRSASCCGSASRQASDQGRIAEYVDTEVSRDSVWTTLLITMIPIAVIVILILLFMSQMQGGGSASQLRQVAGEADHQGHAQDHLRGRGRRDEAVEELHEIKDFLQNPRSTRPSAPRSPRGAALRSARHR